MNKLFLKGYLTKDPESVENKTGKTLCKFSVAVNRRFKKDTADFFNCVVWDKLAENILTYFKKGSEILVAGRIETDKYDDKEGKAQYRTTVTVEEYYFCGKKSDNTEDKPETPKSNKPLKDDELPF
jgi:single-strand DNA-binding protein